MNSKNAIINLFFDQKQFFAECQKGLLIPVLITLAYALLSIVFILPDNPVIAVITVIGGVIGVFISWAVVAGMFLAGVKLIGYAKCTYKQMLAVTGYASAILALGAVLTGTAGLIGTAEPLLDLAVQGALMFWCIPVWVFGIASITDLPPKKVFTCILVPMILMIIMSVVSYMMTTSVPESTALYAGSRPDYTMDRPSF